MTTMDKKKPDVVFNILETMLRNSPEASYSRLNPALRSCLGDCISADLPFLPDTFSRIYNELRGSWWFGDGAGSAMGEHYYAQAIAVNHAAAYQSFEQFAGRPGVLWEENAGLPVRLHVGAEFTWKGTFLTVTSMRADSLVACAYKEVPDSIEGIKVGATIGRYNEPHVITSVKRAGGAFLVRAVKSKLIKDDRTVSRRLTISYEEIAEFRRSEKARLKKILARIAECDPEKDAAELTKAINAEKFRHFCLEEIRAAFAKREGWVANQDRVGSWRKGRGHAWLDVKATLLRVKGDSVECSNGNRVSLASVRRALPILLDRRGDCGRLDLPLDGHTLTQIDAEGVTVGCTEVPWAEIDLIKSVVMATPGGSR